MAPNDDNNNNNNNSNNKNKDLIKRQSLTKIEVKQDREHFFIQGRESHTADLKQFDLYVRKLQNQKRNKGDCPFNAMLWQHLREQLQQHGFAKSLGYDSLEDPQATIPVSNASSQAFGAKVAASADLHPIHPLKYAAAVKGTTIHDVLTEFFYASLVGMVTVKFIPECYWCGGSVCEDDDLHALSKKANDNSKALICEMCNYPNQVTSLDTIKCVFEFHPSILYILTKNNGCRLSHETKKATLGFGPVPATETSSGFRYTVGCDSQSLIAKPLEKGRYRIHCPIGGVSCWLDVQNDIQDYDENAEETTTTTTTTTNGNNNNNNNNHPSTTTTKTTATDVEPYLVTIKASEINQGSTTYSKTITVPHGRIQFDCFPDTGSLFCLWIQTNESEKTIMHLPQEQREPFTSAAVLLHHPSFHRYYYKDAKDSILHLHSPLEVATVFLVFTDVVRSTDMYASLGDWRALDLVSEHYRILFASFNRTGRVVKTVGDAVMAAFTSGQDAIIAAAEALSQVQQHCRRNDGVPFQIRIGIHGGPAVVVPLNGVNDYFGQTVNKAARIEGKADPSGCLISETTLQACPEIETTYRGIINDNESEFVETPRVELNLKGVTEIVFARGFRLRQAAAAGGGGGGQQQQYTQQGDASDSVSAEC